MNKPYKITKKGKCTIVENIDDKYIIKEKPKKNIKRLYEYLDNRGFYNYPKLIDEDRDEYNKYEYIEDTDYPKEQKAMDMINLVSDLHNKTMYHKEVREDTFKNIYDTLNNNLLYYKSKYDDMVNKVEEEKFMSPSHYLFIRSSSKLFSEIEFCTRKLNTWYENVKNKREVTLSVNHNNLELNHFRKNKDSYLISFDDYKIDSPILDIYKFYRKECLNLEFRNLLNTYFNNVNIPETDKELFIIMICMPSDINFTKPEYDSSKYLERKLDYIYKTEELVGEYYSSNGEVEED